MFESATQLREELGCGCVSQSRVSARRLTTRTADHKEEDDRMKFGNSWDLDCAQNVLNQGT